MKKNPYEIIDEAYKSPEKLKTAAMAMTGVWFVSALMCISLWNDYCRVSKKEELK